jgi:hypothetical protein
VNQKSIGFSITVYLRNLPPETLTDFLPYIKINPGAFGRLGHNPDDTSAQEHLPLHPRQTRRDARPRRARRATAGEDPLPQPQQPTHRRRDRLPPITPGGANLFFQLVNARYEKGAMILTSNCGFAEWGEVFGDPVVATALLDQLLHHAVIAAVSRGREALDSIQPTTLRD